MKRQIVACAWAAVIAVGTASNAGAGNWRWGCQGMLGNEQIIFNRDSLLVAPAKPSLGKISELIFTDTLAKSDDDRKSPYDGGGDFTFSPTMTFAKTEKPDQKVTLTEKSSRRVSHHFHIVCGRDETNDIYRKVYRYEREGEPARDIKMECAEYQLSTRGGRPGCD